VPDSLPPFQDPQTDTRRQRAKERIYVTCQAFGWGSFILMQIVFSFLFRTEDSPAFDLTDIAGVVMAGLLGLIISHGSRVYVERWGLKEIGWRRLLPRLIGLAVLLSMVWTIVGFGWSFGIMGEEFPDQYNPFVLMALSMVNGVIIYVCWFLGYFGYHVYDRFNRSEIERLRLAAVVKDAELRALKSQVNPHFIFNSLNSVRALIDEDPQRARSAVTQLANMLRYSLQSGTKETVSFEDELSVVNDYLALEQVRHEERLRLKLEVSSLALHRAVPPMLLQTLVENAVKYGVSTRPSGGEIAIEARIDNSDLVIAVRNPGHLNSVAGSRASRSTGLGLRNALDRLRLLCGDAASIDLRQTGADEVTATVVIPEPKRPSPPSSSSVDLAPRGAANSNLNPAPSA
jgi:two-component sensor histidine kinase